MCVRLVLTVKCQKETRMKRYTGLMGLLCAIIGLSAFAVPVTPDQAKAAVGTWLSSSDAPLGARFKTRSADAAEIRGIRDFRGRTLYFLASLQDGGFVVTSADTDITPIVAFSGTGSLENFEGSPLQALLDGDQGEKLDAVERKNRSPANGVLHSTGGTARGKDQGAASQWARLLAGEAPNGRGISSVSDVRVAKLLETEWDQAEWGNTSDATFNYYTPNGYVCGCVATAGAQIMRYWRQPTSSIPQFSNPDCGLDGYYHTQSSISGTFDWNNMPATWRTRSTLTETERRAIGKLTYNVGVAVGMDWGMYGSGAQTANIVSSFKSRFNYRSGTFIYYMLNAGTVVSGDAQNALYASLDASMPVSLSIGGDGGHSIVADGYGYSSGTRYTHLNMGWSGSGDVWYNLMGEAIQCGYSFTVLKGIGFNIHPSESGDIISGRVVNSSGSAVSGATVTLYSNSGTSLGTATSNAKGIYFFRVTSSGTYRVRATSGAQTSPEATVVISSMSSSSVSGNRWGNDLTIGGGTSSDRPDLGFDKPGGEGWPTSVYLTSDMYGRTAQNSFEDGDTLYIHAGFGNKSQSVALTGAFKVRHEVLRNSSVVASYDYEISSDEPLAYGTVLYWDGFSWNGLQNLPAGNYTYRCTLDATGNISETDENNNVWTCDFSVSGSSISLNTALDNTALSFTTGGSASWFGQTGEYYTGGSSAKSGSISHNQSSWLQTTVSGAGTLSFWWKTSSESGYDKLHLYVDGVELTSISGQTSWQSCAIEFESGTHTVRWSYEKDGSVNIESDCGWVDDVTWTDPAPTVSRVTFDPQGGTVSPTSYEYTPGGEHTPFPTPHRADYLFEGWYTQPNGGGEYVNVASIVPSGSRTLYANWVRSSISLDDALSEDGLSFTTGGDVAGWEQTLRYTYDGEASAQSGATSPRGSSWVQTVVTGPGTLSFRWATSSELNYDKLKFYVDGQEIDAISGATGWEAHAYEIGAGAHTVRWSYEKDGSVDRGWDCGYLDDIRWEGVVPDDEVTVFFDGNGGTASESSHTYSYRADADPMYIYGYMPTATHSSPSYVFDGWYTTATDDGSQVTVDTEVNPAFTRLYAHWRVIQTIPVGTAVNASSFNFTFGGDAPWFGQSNDSYDGDGAAQSGVIGDGRQSWMETVVNGAGVLSFWWKTSSESGYDKLRISIDGSVVEEFSGINGWTRFSREISGAGDHVIRWIYQKDGSVSVGEDCARVDAIQFGDLPPPLPSDPHRWGLCVGINEYYESYIPSYNWLSCCVSDAMSVWSLLTGERCGWPAEQTGTLFNTDATKSAVVGKLNELAQTAQAGDQVIYFHSSHGGQNYGTSTYICMADQSFQDTDFAQVISAFRAGVKLLIVIDACHSGGMFKALDMAAPAFDPEVFVSRVTERLNEIRYEELVAGKRDMPRIAAGDIAWITAADYDQYSWENQNGGFFTTEFVNCIRTGAADLNAGYGEGDNDGQVEAWEAGTYVQNRWDGVLIGGQYYMTPQLGNDAALHAFEFYNTTSDDPVVNLRWCAAAGWPQAMYLSDAGESATAVSTFTGDDTIYMYGAFQNDGEDATRGPFVIRHEVFAAGGGSAIVSWNETYSSVLAADPGSCVGWVGAVWDGLNGLPTGDYLYKCTLDPDNQMDEVDEADNVVTFSFEVTSPSTVTVVFNGNGGTVSQSSVSYVLGSVYGSLPTAERPGYEFDGWFTAAVGGSRIAASDTVTADRTMLYAQWRQATFPDLVAENLTSTKTSVGPMESFTLNFTVRNAGVLNAPSSTAAVYADFDGAGWERIGDVSVSGVAAGSAQSYGYRVEGGRFAERAVFKVVADADEEIVEASENNNESATCSVSVGAIQPPSWVAASVSMDPQALPTVFDSMHVTIDGENVPQGSFVGIFRTDTGALCGRSEVYSVDGKVTMFVSVVAGTVLHFKVWSPEYGELDAPNAADEVVNGSGAIISGKELAIRGGLSNFDLTFDFADVGWHLMSLNVLPDDPSPANVFGGANGGIDYVVGDGNRLWGVNLPTSSLQVMEIGKGYWVHTQQPNVRFTVNGTPNQAMTISLNQGWNMVGYALVAPASAAEALETAVRDGKIAYVCGTSGSLFPYSPLTMVPGEGYWMYATADCTFSYDTVDAVGMTRSDVQRDASHPWAGLNPVVDQVMPTIFENMVVTVNGAPAAKGDVIATFNGQDFLGAVEVGNGGIASWSVMATGEKTLHFKLWQAETGDVFDGSSNQDLTANPGNFYRDMTLSFGGEAPTPGTVVVTFDANGGAASQSSRTLTSGSELGFLPTARREGYRFLGWYTLSIGGSEVSPTTVVNASVTYYAHWELNSYRVIFYANYPAGASGSGTMNEQMFELGVEQALLANEFRAEGWSFAGWSSVAGGEIEYRNRQNVSFEAAAGSIVRLYAVWREGSNVEDLYPDEDKDGWYEKGVYDGWLFDTEEKTVVGTVKFTLGTLANRKITAKVTDIDGSTYTYENAYTGRDGDYRLVCSKRPGKIVVQVGMNGISGTLGNTTLVVSGRNIVASGGRGFGNQDALRLLMKYQRSWTVSLCGEEYEGNSRLQLDVQDKGVVKISGTLSDGTKVSAKSQLITDADGNGYVPVVVPLYKKVGSLTFLVRLTEDESAELVSDVKWVHADGKNVTYVEHLSVCEIGASRAPEIYEVDETVTGFVGVSMSYPISINELGYPAKFSASGLPAGLKINPDTGEICGVPSKAFGGMAIVSVESSAKIGGRQLTTVRFSISELPEGAVGTFNGTVYYKGQEGSAQMTVSAKGKISAKLAVPGLKVTLTGNSYDYGWIDEEDGSYYFGALLTGKVGKETAWFDFFVSSSDAGSGKRGVYPSSASIYRIFDGTDTTDEEELYADMSRNVWKDIGAGALVGKYVGMYTVQILDQHGVAGYESLKIDAKGNIKLTGKLPYGTALSGSLPVEYRLEPLYDNNWNVIATTERICFSHVIVPKGMKNGTTLGEMRLFYDEQAKIARIGGDDGNGKDSCATLYLDDPEGKYCLCSGCCAGGMMDFVYRGAFYNPDVNLSGAYRFMEMEGENGCSNIAPLLSDKYTYTCFNRLGKKEKASWYESWEAVRPQCWGSEDLFVSIDYSGKGRVSIPASKPIKYGNDWYYEGFNDVALTFGFTKATGIFKGSFNCWYDYQSSYDETVEKSTYKHTSKKVSFEGVMLQGDDSEPLRGFYLMTNTDGYEDEKGRLKTYKVQSAYPVYLEPIF